MSRNLNRKRFFSIRGRNIIYLLFLLVLLILFISYNFHKKNISNIFVNVIDSFSKSFEYQYINLEIKGLQNINKEAIEEKLTKYLNSSIFLLPLEKISQEIEENNWIKNVKLTTDYKDKLIINIQEYIPVGVYSFNNNNFYFDNVGKIIDKVDLNNKINENLLIFQGLHSNLEANKILNLIINLNLDKIIKIDKIIYIKKRRWNILTNNGVKLLLSELNLKKSIENFLIIKENLSETKFNNIIKFDLRDPEKTILANRND